MSDWPVITICSECHWVRTWRASGVCKDCEED